MELSLNLQIKQSEAFTAKSRTTAEGQSLGYYFWALPNGTRLKTAESAKNRIPPPLVKH